jgi:histidinol-phosphate/aromatic aminotransferase/cobyric acid decarboxylase-like protein
MIPVTKPFLPPIEEYHELVQGIFDRNWLTNDGPLVRDLESKLSGRLNVPTLFVSNGTIAIQLAIKALGLKGKIITTPFSYVATSSSIVWQGCEPVYVDIEESGYNIDPEKIEALEQSYNNYNSRIVKFFEGNANFIVVNLKDQNTTDQLNEFLGHPTSRARIGRWNVTAKMQ